MFDFQADAIGPDATLPRTNAPTLSYLFAKRAFDLLLCVLLLVPLGVAAVILAALNPILNTGPLFFVQDRMGQGCHSFKAVKFRSMRPAKQLSRGAFDPVERDRVSPLGHIMRRTRVDELPQILNVLKGEMSLIGPRPDAYEHAKVYAKTVPGYRSRHAVLPGISGYAQTELGYAEGLDSVMRKTQADHYYISHATFAFDLWITWRTLCTVVGAKGR